jgi:hypothetical protein
LILFQGSFEENKRSGFGSYTYANGDVYEGLWKNDLKNGEGNYSSYFYESVKELITKPIEFL